MANHDILDNKNHKDVKVITHFDDEFSEKINSALIFPNEIKAAQRDYPILFIKNPDTGQFQSVVLLGLVAGENQYINNGWQASYIPAMINKGPFIIGFEEKEENGECCQIEEKNHAEQLTYEYSFVTIRFCSIC